MTQVLIENASKSRGTRKKGRPKRSWNESFRQAIEIRQLEEDITQNTRVWTEEMNKQQWATIHL